MRLPLCRIVQDSADALRGFKNDGAYVGAALQLKGSGQPGWAGSDNDSGFHAVEFGERGSDGARKTRPAI